jgi:phosphate transport system substrate-binding protein
MSFSRGGFRNVLAATVLTAALLGGFCEGSKQAGVTSQGSAVRSSTVMLTGVGATFPASLYAKWAEAYKSAADVEVNYVTISTGGGIKQIQDRTVDFGALDDPLTIKDLQEKGLFQFPVVIGGVVLAYNLPGFSGELKLDGPTVADIFLGKVKNWDDPSIRRLNPKAQLPHTAIIPVHRSDISGTSFIFTTYLSKVSPVWKSTMPAANSIQWPTGVGRKGNPGVTEFLQRISGAIGYVEYSYAKTNSILMTATLKNKSGQFVRPTSATFAAAAANANWDPSKGFNPSLTNQPGTNSWPIVGVSFILISSQPTDPKRTRAVLSFFDYVFKNGGAIADEFGYVALPQAVTDKVRQAWSEIKGPNGKSVWEQV